MTAKKGKAAKQKVESDGSDVEMDEIDKFHSSRSKILLSDNEESQEEFYEDDEEEVMKLNFNEDGDENDEDGGFEDDALEEDADDEENEELKAWGKQKKSFYAADADAEQEEEVEAKRLQKLRTSGLSERDFVDDSFSLLLKQGNDSAVFDEEQDEEFEVVEKDLKLLSSEEKRELVEKKAPELMTLLTDLKESLSIVKDQIEPILEKTKSMPTSQGLDFLKVKYYLLMSYCTNIAFYLMLKCEGKKIENHPVIDQLVKLRMLLDKVKPLEAKMKYQVDKYMKMADSAIDQTLTFKANLDNFVDDEDPEDTSANVYKAPKVTPMYYEENQSALSKKTKLEERLKKNASKSRLLKELAEEFSEKPQEIVDKVIEEDPELRSKLDYEEDNFMRFTLSKKEIAKLKKTKRFVDELDELGDFGEFKDKDEEEDQDGESSKALSKYLSKIEKGKSKKQRSGDEDLSLSNPASKKQKTQFNSNAEGNSDYEDNDYYESVKADKKHKASSKPQREVSFAPIEDMQKGKKRAAGYQIVKNKGLTPKRNKEVRNPRVKQRNRFDKAEKKLKSFKPVSKESGPYTGQHTGIKKGISRSVKF